MFFLNTPVQGNAMPSKTLCLTYDDGPGLTNGSGLGPRTDDLGFYLFLQGVPATFFVIGDRAATHAELLLQLTRWGHLIVNHTQDHAGLPGLSNSAAVAQILDADASIAGSKNSDSPYVRPPYGHWSAGVAAALNAHPTARNLVGPILWDIDGNDWQFWKNGESAESCANHYYDLIRQIGRGIVLMHDSSAEAQLAAVNNAYEMTRLLLPRLRDDGFRFVRLDAVAQVRSASQVRSLVALKAFPGYISPQSGGGGAVLANGPAVGAWEELGLVPLGANKVALRTGTGHFLSAYPLPGGEVLADGEGILEWEVFELKQLSANTIALKAHTGRYLSAPNNSQIRAVATAVGTAERLMTIQLS